MRGDIQFDLCAGCGERSPEGLGLFAGITHSCPRNTFTYRMPVSMSFKKMWDDMFAIQYGGRSSMASFYDLLDFPYFKAMPNFDTASYMDRFVYSLCRDNDVAAMKRLRAHIELEEDFNSKY